MSIDAEPNVKKNVARQATKIIHDISNAYSSGLFDDPASSSMFCQLLACICEGKVEGVINKDTNLVQWSLTADFSKELEKVYADLSNKNVVRGPW